MWKNRTSAKHENQQRKRHHRRTVSSRDKTTTKTPQRQPQRHKRQRQRYRYISSRPQQTMNASSPTVDHNKQETATTIQHKPSRLGYELVKYLSNRNYRVGNADDGLHDGASQALAQALHEASHAAVLSSAHGSLEHPRNARGYPAGDILAPLISNSHSSGKGKRGQGGAPNRATSSHKSWSVQGGGACFCFHRTLSFRHGGIGREQGIRTRNNVSCYGQRGNLIC